MTKRSVSSLFLLAALVAIGNAQSTKTLPLSLQGTTENVGWQNFNPNTFTGTGNFPGTDAWDHSLSGNVGTGDAKLLKTANSATFGGAYVASSSLYFGSFQNPGTASAGTVAITDTTPLAGLKTVVFQLEIGEAVGRDIFTAPTLTYTAGTMTSTLNALYSSVLARQQTGTFPDPSNGNQPSPVYRNLRVYQFDLSNVSGVVSNYAISFTGYAHAQAYGMQLDATDFAYGNVQAVPEPASMAALAVGALALVRRKRRA